MHMIKKPWIHLHTCIYFETLTWIDDRKQDRFGGGVLSKKKYVIMLYGLQIAYIQVRLIAYDLLTVYFIY